MNPRPGKKYFFYLLEITRYGRCQMGQVSLLDLSDVGQYLRCAVRRTSPLNGILIKARTQLRAHIFSGLKKVFEEIKSKYDIK